MPTKRRATRPHSQAMTAGCARRARKRVGQKRIGQRVDGGERHEACDQDRELRPERRCRVQELRHEGHEERDGFGVERRHEGRMGKRLARGHGLVCGNVTIGLMPAERNSTTPR
jgi:hypothetical protein